MPGRQCRPPFPQSKKTTGLTPGDAIDLFNCGNPVFGFDKDNVCTALTADISGNIWVSGKKRKKFSLFKVVQGANGHAACRLRQNGVSQVDSVHHTRRHILGARVRGGPSAARRPRCHRWRRGRRLPLRRRIGRHHRGRRTPRSHVLPDIPQAEPTTVGRGGVWSLNRGEQLQSATLVQKYVASADTTRNWALITTSAGRLLSRELPWVEGTTTVVTDHTLQANIVAPASCGPTAMYDIQSSVKTRAVYVSDRRGCRALALRTNIDATDFGSSTTLAFTASVVIASTSPTSGQAQLDAPPEAVSIAPGVAISMAAECADRRSLPARGRRLDQATAIDDTVNLRRR